MALVCSLEMLSKTLTGNGKLQTANCKLQTAVMTQSNAVTRPQCKNTMRNAVSGNQIALPTGGGGLTPYTGYIGMCRCEGYGFRCEGYGFQAVNSGIGYINQRVWV